MTPLYIRIRELVNEIETIGEAVDLIISLERKFDMRGSTWTREDVNSRFRDYLSIYDHEERDMTDEEWKTFSEGYLWSKGYGDLMNAGMHDAIADSLYELKLVEGIDW